MANKEEYQSTIAATHGGDGWQPRPASSRAELAAGALWHPCGYRSEWGVLKEVVLSWPGEELNYPGAANGQLMLAKPKLAAMRRQASELASFYERAGVTVHFARPATPPPPNFIFMRDLFWATPEGVVLGRPAALQRAGEERFAQEALARLGVPIVLQPRGRATFEGADALWLDHHTVLIGTGVRTNPAALAQLAPLLAALGAELIPVPLPAGVQHLLGIVNFAAPDLAVVNGGRASSELLALLAARRVRAIILPPDEELTAKLGMNFVTLGPRQIVMPAGCPGIKRRLGQAGIGCAEIEVGEYLKAAGGLACLTGILRREMAE